MRGRFADRTRVCVMPRSTVARSELPVSGRDAAIASASLFQAAEASSLFWSRGAVKASRLTLFGLAFENTTLDVAVSDTLMAAARGTRRQIVFVNAHVINTAATDAAYAKVISGADYLLSDGSGMAIAAKWAKVPFIANTNGTDFFPLLCREAVKSGQKIFLLGGAPRVAELAAETIFAAGYGDAIAGTHHGFFKPGSADEAAAIAAINASGADIVLAGLGVPLQDVWLAENHARLTAPVVAGVGGLLDFFAGRVSRAPMILRSLGLEWTWRLMQEPGRLWHRYLVGNVVFLVHAARAAAHVAALRRQHQRTRLGA